MVHRSLGSRRDAWRQRSRENETRSERTDAVDTTSTPSDVTTEYPVSLRGLLERGDERWFGVWGWVEQYIFENY